MCEQKRSLRRAAFKWAHRKRTTVKEVTPIIAYEAGYRAALADLTGQQYRRLSRVGV